MKVNDLMLALRDLGPEAEVTGFFNFRSHWRLESGDQILLIPAAGGLAWRRAIEEMNELCRAGLVKELPTTQASF